MGLHFSSEEFKSRKNKVITKLKEEKIDALVMFRQESMYWPVSYTHLTLPTILLV